MAGRKGVRAPAVDALDAGEAREIVRRLAKWFRKSAREFPWRAMPLGERRDPYGVLVSETMLQQTQASRVIERYERFMARFATVESLAACREDDVLELWSGLGYYQRARRLREAAKSVVEGGGWPRDAAGLRELPGVGRYTAGAVASLAFGERVAAVDGNVARVMLRVRGEPGVLNHGPTMRWVEERVNELHSASRVSAAVVNEGLIELGATVCTPSTPKCGECPLGEVCAARAQERQSEIPAAAAAAVRKPLHCATLLCFDDDGRMLVERRASSGLWAGLWQAPTIEGAKKQSAAEVAEAFGLARKPKLVERFSAATSHRDVSVAVYTTDESIRRAGTALKSSREISRLGLSTIQRRVLVEIAGGMAAE